MATLIEQHQADVGEIGDGALLVDPVAFAAATGWELKPEGLCRGDACVPVSGTDLVSDGRVDVTAFAERLGQSVVVDAERGVAAIGGDPMARGRAGSLGDVTLPLVDGGQLDFGDLVGKKTLLIAWASW